ncbi:MAG TPA: hypothetical protein VGF99_05355 [Myxococcota bacterium]
MDVVSMVVVTLMAVTGCNPPGVYNEPDAGPDDGANDAGVTAAQIGTPCVYNPARPNESPTNQCASGLTCAIYTRDKREALLNDDTEYTGGLDTLGLQFPIHEDHFTINNDDGTDTGYCTLIGNESFPPDCPVGTIAKRFSSFDATGFAIACLKPCETSAECVDGAVCDTPWFDDGFGGTVGFCVRPCVADFPDCVRTGVVNYDPADGTAIGTQLAAQDLSGTRMCNQTSGVCEPVTQRGFGNDGDACDDSTDCEAGAGCVQLDAAGNRLDRGYCARRCYLEADGDPTGTCGTALCQVGMTFGYQFMPVFDPGAIYAGAPSFAENSTTIALNGLCFDGCVDAFGCGADRPTVSCAAADAAEVGGPWNGQTMCLPPGVILETD